MLNLDYAIYTPWQYFIQPNAADCSSRRSCRCVVDLSMPKNFLLYSTHNYSKTPMNFSALRPAHEFLQVRIFRTCQVLCDILESERQFITRFELTKIQALEQKKVDCINNLEYLMSRVEARSTFNSIPGTASSEYQYDLYDFARAKSALYLQMGSAALLNQIQEVVLGTQSLITFAMHQISNSRSTQHHTGGPMDSIQAQDLPSDLMGANSFLDLQETILEQVYASNQHLLILIKTLFGHNRTERPVSESE